MKQIFTEMSCLPKHYLLIWMISMASLMNAQPISGTKSIGPGGDYPTLTSAISDLSANGMGGSVMMEILTGYTSSAEVFPITIPAISGISSTSTLTIRPHLSISGVVSIEGSANVILDLNGARYVTIDGRPGGIGTDAFISIENTSTTGAAVRFINDACFNTLIYSEAKGVNPALTGGVILFGTTTGVRGNDSNTIDNCLIHEGVSIPANGIYSEGSTASVQLNNSDNTIRNSKIYNCWNTNAESGLIKLAAGTTSWKITGCSFYQTALRKGKIALLHYAININNTVSAKDFTITHNFIGGSEPLCGGSPYTAEDSNNVNVRFTGIYVNGLTTGSSLIQHNTITNFNWKSYSTSAVPQGVWTGILVAGGLATIDANTIGDPLALSAILITNGNTGATVIPIASSSASVGITTISNNTIAGITGYCLTATQAINFNGIFVTGAATPAGTRNIINNKIGSDLPGSIAMMNKATVAQAMVGIFHTGSATTNISGNTIRNLLIKHAGTTTGQVVGIRTNSGVNGITGNTILNLTNTTPQAGINAAAAIIGILQSSPAAGQVVSRNTIHSLLNDSVTNNAVTVTGIYYTSADTGNNIVSANFIHHLISLSTNTTATINGVVVAGGAGRYYNNMIGLGYDTLGSALTTGHAFYGIAENAGSNSYYFNTINIGGSGVVSASNTYAFYSVSTSNAERAIQNNIFVNGRLNGSGTGQNYAIGVGNIVNLSSNSNIYFVPGIGGFFARIGLVNLSLFSDWKSTTGLDGGSVHADPMLVNPDGTASTIDLHIESVLPTPVEGNGSDISFITDDFDGNVRSTLTPFDIGADAGNFIVSDNVPPAIFISTPSTFSKTDRVITARIYDGTGVPVTNAPVVYYKKSSAGAYASANGTLVSGTRRNGNWSFTLSASSLGGLTDGDSVYYYIVAQDSSALLNIESYPAGVAASGPSSVVTEPVKKIAYLIYRGFAGNLNIGAGETYTSLTAAGGIFEAINKGGLVGNLTLFITSDLTETGLNGLNKWREDGAGNYSLSIRPDTATERLISGATATGMIKLNGATRVTIDGRFDGTGRYLRFRNTNTLNATIHLLNDTKYDTIQYCHVEGASTNTDNAVILIGTGIQTGNDSLVIIHNKISGLTSAASLPASLILGTGTAACPNDYNQIQHNQLFNYAGGWAVSAGVGTATGNGNYWNISHNSIYQTAPRTSTVYGIYIYSGGGHIVSYNSIGGSDSARGGSAMTVSGSSDMVGIGIQVTNSTIPVTFNNNTISNFGSHATSSGVMGILYGGGELVIRNNTMGGGALPSDTIAFGAGTAAGIFCLLGNGNVDIQNNTLSHFRKTNGASLAGILISPIYGTVSAKIKGNTIRNFRSGTPANAPLVGINLGGGSLGNNVVDSNFISDLLHTSVTSGAYTSIGIVVEGASDNNNTITRNRISSVGSLGSGSGAQAPVVGGILVSSGNNMIANNQVSLGNDTGDAKVYGIMDGATLSNNYFYNSVFLNGTMYDGSVNHSYCFQRTGTNIISLKNNIFYTKRQTLGTGKQLVFGSTGAAPYASSVLNYNLLIASDTAKILEVAGSGVMGWGDLSRASGTAGVHNTNWTELVSTVPADSLFTDTATGNLGILTNHTQSWYANGKGIAIANISGDYSSSSAVRSVSVSTGATDIGSVEFTPQAGIIPAAAVASIAPLYLDITAFVYGGRTVAKATWGTLGTLPATVDVRYFSGTNPSGIPTGRTHTNAYWQMTPTGGSGYNFILSLLQDTAILGTVSNATNLDIAQHVSASNWTLLASSTDIAGGTVFTSSPLTGFGIFTGTDAANNPLPVKLRMFTATAKGEDVLLNWITGTEINNKGFEIERSVDNNTFQSIQFVKGKNNGIATNGYAFTDRDAFVRAKHQTLYYRLKQVDVDGNHQFSETVRVSQHATASFSVYPNPATSAITVLGLSGGAILYDILGNEILHVPSDGELDISALKQGIYFIRSDGASQKLIKY